MIADQRHHLHEQFKQLRLGIWEKWLGVLLRLATALSAWPSRRALAFMVWDAAHSNGLLIEPFSVPPDLAARGLTGEVVAAKLLDQLPRCRRRPLRRAPPKSYTNTGADGIKLDIPETGVSLGEAGQLSARKTGP